MDKNFKKIGVVGVDSGTLMITDPCYATNFKDKYKDADGNYCYDAIIDMKDNSLQLKNEIGAELGLVFSSGYGDGVYEVYAKEKDGRVSEVLIKLI